MLYVFVEGADDEAYFGRVFGNYFDNPKFIRYSQKEKKSINKFLKSIGSMPHADYIFFGDGDGKEDDEKKAQLRAQYPNLSESKIFIVKFEIESWYYAGADEMTCKDLKLKNYIFQTEQLTKEQFCAKLNRIADRKIIMAQILERYKLDLAVTRNKSLEKCVNAII